MGGHGTGAGEPVRRIGPYRIVALLGEGGMGAVHLGRDRRGRPAAVKVLRAELSRDTEMVRRFRREADAASAVRGPGVARVLGYDLDGPVPWIAAAYLAGPTLQEAVAACGPFTEDAARALVAELARTVAVIHDAGLVHRDLKPSNIVLTRSGARIIDFGIARPEYGLTLTQPGVAPATPGYAPPEQITGRRAGPPADVFALGAVLAFACTGEGPFGAGHPAAVGYRVVHEEPSLDGVPEALLPVARACLQKEATRRPTPGVVAGWVARDTDTEGPPTGPAWLTAPLATEITRRAEEADRLLREAAPSRRRVLTAAAATVPVAAIATGTWWLTRDPSTPAEGRRTENGVPVAAPLTAPTADTVPAPLWRTEGLHPDGPGPVTVGRVVAAGTAEGVAAWTQHTGRRAWTWAGRTAPDRHGDLLVSGTALLVVTADGRLTALDSRTGAARWRTGDIGAAQTLAVDDDSAYVLDGERRVKAVDLTAHRSRWTSPRPLGGTGTARAAVTRQRLMVSTDDGTAQVFDTRDGTPSWRWTIGRPVLFREDSFQAVSAEDGTTLWTEPIDLRGLDFGRFLGYERKHRLMYYSGTGSEDAVPGATGRTQLISFDVRYRTEAWRLAVPAETAGEFLPVFDEKDALHVLYAADGALNLVEVDRRTGRAGRPFRHTWRPANRKVGVSSVSQQVYTFGEGRIEAAPLRENKPLWRLDLSADPVSGEPPELNRPSVAKVPGLGTVLYTSDTTRTVYAIDPARGRELWRRTLLPDPPSSGILDGPIAPGLSMPTSARTLLAYGRGAGVVALDPSTGAVKWTFQSNQTANSLYQAYIVDDRDLALIANGPSLFAFPVG
ncbi:PQQ-binding-like beta-propeller repeat protein [Streptomyces sp. NPDC050211]|uniref:protein kinase domain-containing protein n=1 Tax=Streptomyces sp. NPDC050211 TaxID=3154932 RepID=UPI0034167D0E